MPRFVSLREPAALWLVTLVAVAGAVYANSLHGAMIFDDQTAIVTNPNIRHLWPLSVAASAPPASCIDGRPLVCLSLAINYAIGGINPLGYHVFNLAVHLACVLLAFSLIRRTLLLPRWQGRWSEPAAAGFAGVVTLLWSVHPLLTESVDY